MSTENLTLQELVNTLEQQNQAKRDFVLPSSIIKMEGGMIVIPKENGGEFVPNEVMHQHLAQKLGIPANYYRRMQELAPDLLEANVNKWLAKNEDKNVLVRTFQHEYTGNIARGMLSDRYGMIDNYDILFAALQAIKESGVKVDVKQTSVTDKRLYINIIAPEIEIQAEEALRGYLRDSQVGYGIVTGLSITNSEVGFGSYEIRPRALIKRCMNGMIIKDDAFRKVHLGGQMKEGSVSWSEKTVNKNLELIISQTGDAIKQFLSEDYLSGIVQKLTYASRQKLDQPLDAMQNAIVEVAKSVTITDENKKNLLNYFVQDGDTSASGIVHAFTREAQNMDADRRFEIESLSFDILGKAKSFDHEFKAGKN